MKRSEEYMNLLGSQGTRLLCLVARIYLPAKSWCEDA